MHYLYTKSSSFAVTFTSLRKIALNSRVIVCYKSRHSAQVVNESRDLPWIQYSTDEFERAPFLHHLFGRYIIRERVKDFNKKDFLSGVQQAITIVTDCIRSHDADDELKTFVSPALSREFKVTFDNLKYKKKRVDLVTERTPINMSISNIQMILGETDDGGDELDINFLALRIVTSKKRIHEEMEKDSTMKGGFNAGYKVGMESIWNKMRLQIDVNFELSEHYALRDVDCDDDFDKNHRVIYHKWKFETEIYEDKQLDWTIVDIDDFLKNKNVKDDDEDTI